MPTTFNPRHTSSARAAVLDVLVSRIEAGERARRAADAMQLVQLAEAFHAVTGRAGGEAAGAGAGAAAGVDEFAFRAFRAELACALHMSEQTVERRISHAVTLTTRYPETLTALRAGTISLQHANVVTDAGDILGIDDSPATTVRRAGYEQAVLQVAVETTPGRLRALAKRLAEQYAEAPLAQRHERARHGRGVFVVDREDGMSDLVAHLPAFEAHSIYDRITRMSRVMAQEQAAQARDAAQAVPAEPVMPEPSASSPADAAVVPACRTRNEIRADLFTELLLKSDPDAIIGSARCGATGIQAQVQVMITDTVLWEQLTSNVNDTSMGERGDTEALLAGYGPISPYTASEIAADTDRWNLVTTHPQSGAVIAVESYRPSARMRRMLMVRDEHCRFPGCRAPVQRCDIDHTIDAQYGGPTATTNLAHLCRGHHTLKHHGGWRVRQHASGVLEWWSPAGRKYVDRPPSMVRFEATTRPPPGSASLGAPPPCASPPF